MARPLPAPIRNAPPELTEAQDKILWYLADGGGPAEMARALAPGDRMKQKSLRVRVYQLMAIPHIQEEYVRRLHTVMVTNLGAANKGLMRKTRAGRVDAIKLLFEATNFYNPRTEVAHTGDIQVTIKGLPRPERTVDESTVTDAEVVEE